jgi:predicted glycoside hydrolase/deacetylase ChbG (UPF0249 family)
MLIINADDFGRTIEETDAALECFSAGRITSTTAMVFMRDSERAAQLALRENLPTGLHLNLSQTYTGNLPNREELDAHRRVVRFISASKYCIYLYHPLLRSAFRRVFESQFNEFVRLFGKPPTHIDGHQHRHLCLNMVLDRIFPAGFRVRRNFTYLNREKSFLNRSYRKRIDSLLSRHYQLTDYFFSLADILKGTGIGPHLMPLATKKTVEVMTHPLYEADRQFLLDHNICQNASLRLPLPCVYRNLYLP